MRYKIREEKKGATVFDQQKGQTTILTEPDYLALCNNDHVNFKPFFDDSVKQLFTIYRSTVPREALPSDCLSAPSKVYFEITRKCNLSCSYCYNKSSGSFFQEISKETIFRLIEELERMGTFEIRLTGGEPTTHPDFFEIVDYAIEKGFFVSLGSNGIFSETVADRIKASGIRIVIISLDGPEAINDLTRSTGTFKKAVATIQRLQGMTLKINCVLSTENLQYIKDIVLLAETYGVEAVNFAPLKVTGRANTSRKTLTPRHMMEIVSKINELRSAHKIKLQTYYDILVQPDQRFPSSLLNKKSCAAGIEVAAISPFGEVYGCVVSPANETTPSKAKDLFTAGSLLENTFADIWLDSNRWKTFRALDLVKNKTCTICKHYAKNCFGNCVVESYLHTGALNGQDPYCFKELI